MDIKSKIGNVLSKRGLYYALFYFLRLTRLERLIEDELFLRLKFYCYMGEKLHINSPKTYNEKLQWLKINDRNPLYTIMVDKYAAKEYVAERIGKQYVFPTLGVWDDANKIDFEKLPNQFVLKGTHDSGSIIICKDKATFGVEKARKKMKKVLETPSCWFDAREWPYKNVPHRIIAEKYMVDESGSELKDYKIFCFHGKPEFIQVDFGRFGNHRRNVYDCDWNMLHFENNFPSDPSFVVEKPKKLNELLDITKTLCKDLIHVRLDFYIVNDDIYFGEFTFYHSAGYSFFTPSEYDKVVGDMLHLPIYK